LQAAITSESSSMRTHPCNLAVADPIPSSFREFSVQT
jgi:hypothetical protein